MAPTGVKGTPATAFPRCLSTEPADWGIWRCIDVRVIFVVRHRPAFQSPSAPPTSSPCRKQVNCATPLPPAVDPLSYVYPAITFRDGPGTVQIWLKQLIIGLRAQLYEFACLPLAPPNYIHSLPSTAQADHCGLPMVVTRAVRTAPGQP